MALNFREMFTYWNMSTALWMQHVMFYRVPYTSMKTVSVFLLSSFFHGFYPGYYICFLFTGSLQVIAARQVSISLFLYDVIYIFIYPQFWCECYRHNCVIIFVFSLRFAVTCGQCFKGTNTCLSSTISSPLLQHVYMLAISHSHSCALVLHFP